MSGPAAVASVVAGALLVLLVLRDVFHELFHPAGDASLSRLVQRATWRAFRGVGRWRADARSIAGPACVVLVITTWSLTMAVGWALVYWPWLPEAFRYATAADTPTTAGFVEALYFSTTALATLGFGDITPRDPALRLLSTAEAAIGFGLLTAGISWVLSIYPVLSRRRTLARRATLLDAARERTGRDPLDLDPVTAAALLGELAAALAQVHVDLVQSGITYYFGEEDATIALPVALARLARLADDGAAAGRPDAVRFAAATLGETVRQYAARVGARHLGLRAAPLDEVLARLAADHGHGVPAPGAAAAAARG